MGSVRLDDVSEAWRIAPGAGTIVFENVDGLASTAARELLATLLATCPQERTLALCARDGLPLALDRYTAPHRILTLGPSALAIGDVDLHEALRGSGIAPATIARVCALAEG